MNGERLSRPARWAIAWILLVGLWVALTDTVKLQELIAGSVVAAFAATLAGRIVMGTPRGSGAAAPRWRAIARPPLRLVVETAILALAIWRRLRFGRPLRGSLRLERYEGGQVLTEWWGSLGPNRYVIGIDEEGGAVLVHELVSDEPGVDRADLEDRG